MLPAIETPEIRDPEPTPLASHLAVPNVAAQGVLTPSSLDAPEVETEALLHGTALHDLGWLRLIEVKGEDRERWLSGMVTNMVEALPSGAGAYNLVLNAQGRIQGDATIWRISDRLWLQTSANQAPVLASHFDHFIIMDDVELVPLDTLSALGLTGPAAEALISSIGLHAPALPEGESQACAELCFSGFPIRIHRLYSPITPQFAIWAPAAHIPTLWARLHAAGATPVGYQALESLRILSAIPLYGTDIESRDLPQETSQTRALHFAKGCYLGQEIVERIRSRGQVHRHLRQLELTLNPGTPLPAPGTELRKPGAADDSKPAAILSSVTQLPDGRAFALAVVRAEAEIGNPTLLFSTGSARVLSGLPKLS